MARYRQTVRLKGNETEVILRLQALQTPELRESIERLLRRYRRYATSAEEVRAVLDKALGDRTLTEELYRLRGK